MQGSAFLTLATEDAAVNLINAASRYPLGDAAPGAYSSCPMR